MHLTALWQWPPLAASHSPILTPERHPPERKLLEDATAVDFEDTAPAFIFLEGQKANSSGRCAVTVLSARNDWLGRYAGRIPTAALTSETVASTPSNKDQWIESFEGRLQILRAHLTGHVLSSMSNAAWHSRGARGDDPTKAANAASADLDARAKNGGGR
jgi:hypothetical protein